jgi:hypothetical protein
MAKRLRQEENWISTARSLLNQAFDQGIDLLGLGENRPEEWSNDLMESLDFHVDFEDYWPDGPEEEGTGVTKETEIPGGRNGAEADSLRRVDAISARLHGE